MKENLLKKLYTDELKDLFSAENQLVKALPKMAKAATSHALRAGFEGHLKQTQEHVARLGRAVGRRANRSGPACRTLRNGGLRMCSNLRTAPR